MIKKIINYFNEVRAEFKKVAWSSRHEVISSTMVVFVAVFILSLYVGICDSVLFFIVSRLFR